MSLDTLRPPLFFLIHRMLIHFILPTIHFRIFGFPFIPNMSTLKYIKLRILNVVLYGCKIWSLKLRKKHRLTVLKHGVEDRRKRVNGVNKRISRFIIFTPYTHVDQLIELLSQWVDW